MQQINIDDFRREFSLRFRELVQTEPGTKKLESFSFTTGVSLRQASEWGNQRHLTWPSAANLIQVAITKNVSLNWLMLGEGPKKRIIDKRVVRELVEIISNLPEKEEAALLSILDKVLMRYRYGERAKAGKNTDGDVGRPRAGGTKKN